MENTLGFLPWSEKNNTPDALFYLKLFSTLSERNRGNREKRNPCPALNVRQCYYSILRRCSPFGLENIRADKHRFILSAIEPTKRKTPNLSGQRFCRCE